MQQPPPRAHAGTGALRPVPAPSHSTMPAHARPCPVCRPRLFAMKVMVRAACTAMPGATPRSASRPEGTSSASTGAPMAASASMAHARSPCGARRQPDAEQSVDDEIDVVVAQMIECRDGTVPLPGLARHARGARGALGRLRRAHPHLQSRFAQQTGQQEAIAAVVAAAAGHHDATRLGPVPAHGEKSGFCGSPHEFETGRAARDGLAIDRAHGLGVMQRFAHVHAEILQSRRGHRSRSAQANHPRLGA